MLSTFLFATAFALAPSEQPIYVDLTASGYVGYVGSTSSGYDAGPSQGFGSGTLDARVYLHALHDDDAAPDFQPFLQRVGVVDLGGGGGASFALHDPTVVPPGALYEPLDAHHWGSANVAIDGYVTRWLHLGAGSSVRDDHYGYTVDGVGKSGAREERIGVHSWASVGLRWDDTLLSVGWSVDAYRERVWPTALIGGSSDPRWDAWRPARVPFWGGAFANGYTVLARRLGFGLGVDVLSRGAEASGSIVYYVGRRLGLYASVNGGRREDDYFAGVGAGIRYWFTTRVAAAIGYSGSWDDDHQVQIATQQHLVQLSLSVR